MPVAVGLAILAGSVMYVAASYAVLVSVMPALLLAAGGGGVVAGTVVVVGLTVAVLADRHPGTTLVPPVAGPDRDWAWPQYFAAQVVTDIETAVESGARTPLRLFTWVNPVVLDTRPWIYVVWPLPLTVYAFLLAFSGGVVLGAAVVVVLAGTVSAVVWSGGAVAVGLLRGADRAWQWRLRAAASCPRCYFVSPLPAYRCPNADCPHPVHRRLRPGRLGVLWRRCGCGTVLPTTVLRASGRMAALCQNCGAELHRGAGVATDVRVPVFGAASAGKTRLIMAGVLGLVTEAERGGATVELDGASAATLGGWRTALRWSEIPKTSPADPSVATTVRLTSGRRNVLVHVFDAAGESYTDQEENATLAFLDRSRTLVFVLDPFSVPDVRDQLDRAAGGLRRAASPAWHDPEESYNVTAQRLRMFGVDTTGKRLAFVVSKADLLRELPIGRDLDATPGAVCRWLAERGMDNLLTSASRDFAEVSYFLVSSRTSEPTGPSAALAPFRWLLAGDGVELSPPAAGVPATGPAT
jgi:hypothetical protein